MTSIDRDPLTRTELEIVLSCFSGVVQQTGRAGETWAAQIVAKLRGQIMITMPCDDDPCPLVQSAVPFPVPIPATAKRGKGRAKDRP